MFLVGIAAPHLTVAGAIFGDTLTMQRLTDYVYLGPCSGGEERSEMDEGIHQVACVLRALKNCTASLSDYYLWLDPKTIPLDRKAPILPHFQHFTVSEIAYKLTYTDRMAGKQSHKALFVASVQPENDAGNFGSVVVKFTKSYCQDAHKILVEASLAPNL